MPRRAVQPLAAEATETRTEADSPAPPQIAPLAAVEPEPAPEPPGRTPERQRLADAIARVAEIEAEIREAGAAVAIATRADLDASTAFYAAERTFRRAQPGHQPGRPPSDQGPLYEDWIREQSTPPLPIAEARAAMEAARDAKDTARRALEFHKGQRDALSDSLSYRKYDVDRAVKAAVAFDPATAATLAEARRLFLAFQDMQRVVERLKSNDAVDRGAVMGWNTSASYTDPAAWPLTAVWAAAVEALASNPDASLPAP